MDCHQELIIAGLRFYGVLEISQILSQAAFLQGLDVKTAEFTRQPIMSHEIVHIRIGSKIYSPLALEHKVGILACFEPVLEASLALKYLSPEGVLVMNTNPLMPFNHFSKQALSLLEKLAVKVIKLDVFQKAQEAGDISSSNFIMLGVLSGLKNLPVSSMNIIEAIKKNIEPADKEICLKAFEVGRHIAAE